MKTLAFNSKTSLNIQGNQYNVISVLGQGVYGKIYLAELNGVNYTIKEQNQITEQEFDFFMLLTSKKFKNRVNIFALEKNSNGKIYTVIEYCQISLYDKIQQKTFDASQMRFVIKEIANGIKELHDMGLAHKDLTPESILIQEIPISPGKVQERYKICDFGTIQQTERLQNKQLGKPYYLAPEQLDGNKNYTLKADIWSLGAICYELLTNKPLFDGMTIYEIQQRIKCLNINQEIDKLRNMERNHYDLLKQMLQRNPNQRCDIDDVISNLAGTTRTKSINRVDKILIEKSQPYNPKNPKFQQQLQVVQYNQDIQNQNLQQKSQNNKILFSPNQSKFIPSSQSQTQNSTNQIFFNQEQQKDLNLQERVGLNKQNKPVQFVLPGSIPDTLKNNIDFKVSPQKQLLKNDLNQQMRPPLDIKIQPSGNMMVSPPFSNQGGRALAQDKGNHFGIQKSPFKSPNENQFFNLNLQSNQKKK